jgi:hypothetical protein
MQVAQQQRRVTDVQAPPPAIRRQVTAALRAGKRPVFPKAYTKAARNAAMKYAREQGAGGKRVNMRVMMRKATEGHASAYAGKGGFTRRASDRGGVERRSGGDRRGT